MLPIANEPNMVSGNGVNNCKDLKSSFNHETDSQKLPERTILYGQKDRERIASHDGGDDGEEEDEEEEEEHEIEER